MKEILTDELLDHIAEEYLKKPALNELGVTFNDFLQVSLQYRKESEKGVIVFG